MTDLQLMLLILSHCRYRREQAEFIPLTRAEYRYWLDCEDRAREAVWDMTGQALEDSGRPGDMGAAGIG
jgi:hypothetical protein